MLVIDHQHYLGINMVNRKINTVRIFCNDNDDSNATLIKLEEQLKANNFIISDKDYDLAIAIGGDGSFLRMVKKEQYNSNLIYVGINAGTLGFLQEIKKDDIEDFINCLNNNKYLVEEVGVQETIINTKDKEYLHYSLNEIVIREENLNTAFLTVCVNNNLLEKYVGDGLLIATSVGSTAYNLSFGGSIVNNVLHTLQITPIAPLNSKAYRNLLTPVIIPEKASVTIKPTKDRTDLLLSIDGENTTFKDVNCINTKVDDKRLKFLRLENYSFWEKVNDKFLSN